MHPLVLAFALALPAGAADDPDSDRDGLSDFHELHKHLTDPRKADSDGDGKPDGDWLERREYAYTVRVVVHVMKPVTLEHLTDDFQDARLLDESDIHVELEVILYPFGTAHEELAADDNWRKPARELKPWLEPGPTSDWTPELRKRITSDLGQDGIDLAQLSDREAVEKVSDWLMRRAEFHDGFTSFITAFDERGKPYVPDELRGSVEANAGSGLTLEEQWRREVSAAGMYEHKTRGSCTSSAIYLSGCLRAAGIPARTVLCIPLVDANDERERKLLPLGLSNPRVRAIAAAAAEAGIGAWSSHTFNEVWVGGRWRRLNYSRLGQPILDRDSLGLMIHVATFRDWADARMPQTVGRRQKLDLYDDLFGGPNPYSTISLRDQIGVHCTSLPVETSSASLRVDELRWTDDKALPEDIVEGCAEKGRFGLIAVFRNLGGSDELSEFLAGADPTVTLEAEGRATIATRLDAGCWWFKNDRAYVYLPFGESERASLAKGVEYTARAGNANAGFELALDLAVTRR
jgi:hypothetical protein